MQLWSNYTNMVLVWNWNIHELPRCIEIIHCNLSMAFIMYLFCFITQNKIGVNSKQNSSSRETWTGFMENYKNESHTKWSEKYLSVPSVWNTIMECRLNAAKKSNGGNIQPTQREKHIHSDTVTDTNAFKSTCVWRINILVQFRCFKYLIKLIENWGSFIIKYTQRRSNVIAISEMEWIGKWRKICNSTKCSEQIGKGRE